MAYIDLTRQLSSKSKTYGYRSNSTKSKPLATPNVDVPPDYAPLKRSKTVTQKIQEAFTFKKKPHQSLQIKKTEPIVLDLEVYEKLGTSGRLRGGGGRISTTPNRPSPGRQTGDQYQFQGMSSRNNRFNLANEKHYDTYQPTKKSNPQPTRLQSNLRRIQTTARAPSNPHCQQSPSPTKAPSNSSFHHQPTRVPSNPHRHEPPTKEPSNSHHHQPFTRAPLNACRRYQPNQKYQPRLTTAEAPHIFGHHASYDHHNHHNRTNNNHHHNRHQNHYSSIENWQREVTNSAGSNNYNVVNGLKTPPRTPPLGYPLIDPNYVSKKENPLPAVPEVIDLEPEERPQCLLDRRLIEFWAKVSDGYYPTGCPYCNHIFKSPKEEKGACCGEYERNPNRFGAEERDILEYLKKQIVKWG